jgi:hypothetical protein
VIAAAVVAFVVVVALLVYASVRTIDPPEKTVPQCVTVPPVSSEDQRKAATDIALKLEKLKTSGGIEAEFDKTVKSEYAKLSDENMALLLFLNAIHCYLQDGKVGQEVAATMAQVVRDRWASKKGIQGGTPKLSPLEKDELRQSEYKADLEARFRELGLW